MEKTVVIYGSKYGSTRRYAHWIAEELSCPLFNIKEFHPQDLSNYGTIICGGGLYAGSVNGVKLIAKNWDRLSGKKVILFTCGLADPDDPSNVSNIRTALEKSLSAEILSHIHLFHLQGSLDYSRLNLTHKIMMAMLRRMLLKKDPHTLNREEEQILNTYGGSIDLTDRKSLQPLLSFLR